MTRPEDKAKELAQVREMIAQLPELGVVGEPAERERPDFCLTLATGKHIGLEVVRAMDEGIAAGKGAIKKINKRVLGGLRADAVNALVVYSMTEGAAAVLATNGMKKQLAAEVAALVKLAKKALTESANRGAWRKYQYFDDIVNDEGEVCWRDPDRDRGAHDLEGSGIEFSSSVMIMPSNEPHAGSTGLGTGQPRSILQDAINEKAGLLDEYRKTGYDEQWLLVVGSDGTGGSLDISDATDDEFVSPFNRTFFLESFEEICVELRTSHAPP